MSHRPKSITQAVKRSIGEPPLSTSSPSTPHRSVEKNICERSGTSGVKGRRLGLTVSPTLSVTQGRKRGKIWLQWRNTEERQYQKMLGFRLVSLIIGINVKQSWEEVRPLTHHKV